jgi:hypothetical protein
MRTLTSGNFEEVRNTLASLVDARRTRTIFARDFSFHSLADTFAFEPRYLLGIVCPAGADPVPRATSDGKKAKA